MPDRIRWMTHRDLSQVVAISEDAFINSWSSEDFETALGQRKVVSRVLEREDRIAGYVIYELHRKAYHVLNAATSKHFARKGVMSSLLTDLQGRLRRGHRTTVEIDVPEDALHFQFLLKKLGFRAVQVYRSLLDTPQGSLDAYRFLYTLPLDDLLPEKSSAQPQEQS
jgi:[ribosomal protein S18]-alanine N-acetyltransferase